MYANVGNGRADGCRLCITTSCRSCKFLPLGYMLRTQSTLSIMLHDAESGRMHIVL